MIPGLHATLRGRSMPQFRNELFPISRTFAGVAAVDCCCDSLAENG